MELPPQAQGTPYVAFDSTGLVFGVTAAMAQGQGHVSKYNREREALQYHVILTFVLYILTLLLHYYYYSVHSSLRCTQLWGRRLCRNESDECHVGKNRHAKAGTK